MPRGETPKGGLLSYFARHATAANLLFVLLLAAGFLAFPNMRAQFLPDVIVDDIGVLVTWDGAGAEDVDRAIVQVLEPTLLSVEGVTGSSARAREGSANISLEFEPGWDMARAAADVEAAVDSVTTLPEGAEDPRVIRGGWRDRVTDVVISGPVGTDQLGRFADELVTRLFQAGVTRTTIRGLTAPETLVEVTSMALIRHDVTMREIADAVAAAVDANPAGDLAVGMARVRTGVEKRSAEAIAGVPLRTNPDGSTLKVGDVASVRASAIDRERAYFVGDNPALFLRIERSEAGDAIRLQRTVEDIVAKTLRTLPAGMSIELTNTRAEAISGRLEILVKNGIMGLCLVVTLLFLFLNARIAFWVAAGIPVAMLAAISLMYAAGLTLNMISLFALLITLGIVVDDAIVVGEHADFRARRLGEAPMLAAETAARRMFAPVFSSSLTTMIAFFGLVLVGGRFGSLIADIPFTVIAVLLASLLECFLVLPNHLGHALAHSAKEHWYDWPSRQVNKGFRILRDRMFRPAIRLVLAARYPVIALAVALLASQVSLLIRGDVQWRFFNAPETGTVEGNFAMAIGATRGDTFAMMREMQRATDAVAARLEAEHGANPVVHAAAQIGGQVGRGLATAEDIDADLLGGITIELIDADLRPYSAFAFVTQLQDEVRNHPLAETVSFRGGRGGPGGDAIDVQLYGADATTLKSAAGAVKSALARFPEVSALEDSLAYGKEELVLELTAQGDALGFTIDGLGQVLRHRLNGIEAATFPSGPRSAAIRVELAETEKAADFLERMFMRTPSGQYVPLADIVTVESRSGFSTVRREDGVRLVSVTGDLDQDNPDRAAEVMRTLKTEILPEVQEEFGVSSLMAGLAEQEQEFLSDAALGFALSLVGIYLTLCWIFSSWSRPIVVMAIIPFGLVGAIWGHWAWEVPMSLWSVVGLIGLTGIIINDSIVLVGTVDEYAKERGLLPAILDATADRLRPVLLTTLTTVLGLTPLLFESSNQAQFLRPTVITLVYGLGFGFFLVLLVVPALLAIQQDFSRQTKALRRAVRAPAGARVVRTAVTLYVVAIVAIFLATLLPVLLGGNLSGPFQSIVPSGLPIMPVAVVTFTLGIAVAGVAIISVALAVSRQKSR